MKEIINEFADKYHDAIEKSRTLERRGCRVPLKGISSSSLVIDLDKEGSPLASQETRCDFLFIAEIRDELCIFSPLEFKKGALDASKVVGQLQSGVNLLEDHPDISRDVKLVPIAVSGQNPKAQLKKLANPGYQILFKGRQIKVSYMRYGSRLMDVLGKYF
ncbi:MAG: hypothetical protein OXC17_02750 [Aestuariivita sp.]|nr:hypothetical protein [Aestuariivita sp.]